jgi:hypothetical protein
MPNLPSNDEITRFDGTQISSTLEKSHSNSLSIAIRNIYIQYEPVTMLLRNSFFTLTAVEVFLPGAPGPQIVPTLGPALLHVTVRYTLTVLLLLLLNTFLLLPLLLLHLGDAAKITVVAVRAGKGEHLALVSGGGRTMATPAGGGGGRLEQHLVPLHFPVVHIIIDAKLLTAGGVVVRNGVLQGRTTAHLIASSLSSAHSLISLKTSGN